MVHPSFQSLRSRLDMALELEDPIIALELDPLIIAFEGELGLGGLGGLGEGSSQVISQQEGRSTSAFATASRVTASTTLKNFMVYKSLSVKEQNVRRGSLFHHKCDIPPADQQRIPQVPMSL